MEGRWFFRELPCLVNHILPPLFFSVFQARSGNVKMYLILQNFPEEKIIFASESKEETERYFNLQVRHGKGWFEFRKEGIKVPLLAGGEQHFSPYSPSRWDLMQLSIEMQNRKIEESESTDIFPHDKLHPLQSAWD